MGVIIDIKPVARDDLLGNWWRWVGSSNIHLPLRLDIILRLIGSCGHCYRCDFHRGHLYCLFAGKSNHQV